MEERESEQESVSTYAMSDSVEKTECEETSDRRENKCECVRNVMEENTEAKEPQTKRQNFLSLSPAPSQPLPLPHPHTPRYPAQQAAQWLLPGPIPMTSLGSHPRPRWHEEEKKSCPYLPSGVRKREALIRLPLCVCVSMNCVCAWACMREQARFHSFLPSSLPQPPSHSVTHCSLTVADGAGPFSHQRFRLCVLVCACASAACLWHPFRQPSSRRAVGTGKND